MPRLSGYFRIFFEAKSLHGKTKALSRYDTSNNTLERGRERREETDCCDCSLKVGRVSAGRRCVHACNVFVWFLELRNTLSSSAGHWLTQSVSRLYWCKNQTVYWPAAVYWASGASNTGGPKTRFFASFPITIGDQNGIGRGWLR